MKTTTQSALEAAQHTPGPWILEPRSQNCRYWQIGNSDEVPIFSILCNRTEAMANAEFICRACNAHEELLTALRGLLAYADAIRVRGYGDNLECKAARAAIANAEAEGRGE